MLKREKDIFKKKLPLSVYFLFKGRIKLKVKTCKNISTHGILSGIHKYEF